MKKTFALAVVAVVFAGCGLADRAAEELDRQVINYQDNFCTLEACTGNRFTCALPMGAAKRILNEDQLASVRAFIEETDGTCKR